MCKTPIIIKNTNRFYTVGTQNGHPIYRNGRFVSPFAATTQYAAVPCGVCDDCLVVKQSSWIQRITEMSKNYYLFFGTATYMDSMLPTVVNPACEEMHYADYSDFRNMIKRIRKSEDFPAFRYFAVWEYGHKHHRPHFHYLIFVRKEEGDSPAFPLMLEQRWEEIFKRQWKRNISKSTRYPKYKPLSLFIKTLRGKSTYDFHYVRPNSTGDIAGDVSHYITKYVLKPDDFSRKRQQYLYSMFAGCNDTDDWYHQYHKLFMPRIFCSLGIGLDLEPGQTASEYVQSHPDCDIFKYIRQSYVNEPEKGARYFDYQTGKGTYMSRYYKKHFLTLADQLFFAEKSGNQVVLNNETIWLPDTSYTPDDIVRYENNQELWRIRRRKICENDCM